MANKPNPPAAKKKPLKSASPVKSVAEELNTLRKTFRELVKAHSKIMENALKELEQAVTAQDPEALSSQRVHELRDMLTEMRKLNIKPEKGRRKDLKKIESVIEDLQAFVASWR